MTNNDLQEKLENTKGVIRICKSKDIQDNGLQKKGERTNNDQQNIHTKLRSSTTRTPLKTRGECRCFWRIDSNCSTSGIRSLFWLLSTKQKQQFWNLDYDDDDDDDGWWWWWWMMVMMMVVDDDDDDGWWWWWWRWWWWW